MRHRASFLVALTCFTRHAIPCYPIRSVIFSLLHVEGTEPGSIWALLVAGSNGWENYSDQVSLVLLLLSASRYSHYLVRDTAVLDN